MIDIKLREDMAYLAGQIEAINFPFMITQENWRSYHDLLESIQEQYESIYKRVFNEN